MASLLDQIGNPRIIRLTRVAADLPPSVEVYLKAEWFNPGGSVKDRSILRIIEDAERDGRLTADRILLDSSSGHAGIAYAMIAAAKGYRARLFVPENVSAERKAILHALGAEVEYTNPLEGSDGAIVAARALAAADLQRYFFGDQYNNPSNPRAHYETTGREIWQQTGGRGTHFVAGLGTSACWSDSPRELRRSARSPWPGPCTRASSSPSVQTAATGTSPRRRGRRDHTATRATGGSSASARTSAAFPSGGDSAIPRK